MKKKILYFVLGAMLLSGGMAFAVPAKALTQAEVTTLCAVMNCTPQQYAALQALVPTTTPPVQTGYQLTRNLYQGVSGEDVRQLQIFLNSDVRTRVATVPSIGSAGYETMYYGNATTNAVRVFQSINGISTTGTVGPITRGVINQRMGSIVVSPQTFTLTTTAPTNIMMTSATINGMLDMGTFNSNNITSVFFKYGVGGNLTVLPNTNSVVLPQGGTATFSTTLSSLAPQTSYSYQACATSATGIVVCGNIFSFTTTATNNTGIACSDMIDNDGDGFIDYPSDIGCSSTTDNDEYNFVTVYECADGFDNDGDSYVDMYDNGCTSSTDNTESTTITIPAPLITSATVTSINATSATVNISYNGNGQATTLWISYGTNQNNLTSTTATISGSSGAATTSITITGLTPHTTYYVRPQVQTAGGSVNATTSFTTAQTYNQYGDQYNYNGNGLQY